MDDHIVDANKKVDHIIKAAREAGWSDLQLQMASPAELDRLAAFYRLAYQQGMERAAEIALDADHMGSVNLKLLKSRIATAIRAHAQNQPKPIHDSSVIEGN